MDPDSTRLDLVAAVDQMAGQVTETHLHQDHVTMDEARRLGLRECTAEEALQSAARLMAFAASARAAREPMAARRHLVLAWFIADEVSP